MIMIQLFIPGVLFSKDFTLTDIEVNSIKRTRYNTILKIIELKKGSIVSDDITDSVKQKLLASGIFQNEITVTLNEITEDEAILQIDIQERWTLIPIPVGFVNSDSWLAGGVFIESNLLGLNQTVVGGLFASDENIQEFSAWSNPTFLNSNYSFGLSTSFYSGVNEYLDNSGDNILASYDENRVLLSLNVGRVYNSRIGWKIGTGLEWYTADDYNAYLEESDIAELILKNELTLTWDDLYYQDFFNEGWSSTLETTFLSTTDDYLKPSLEVNISKNIILGGKNLLELSVNSGWNNSLKFKPTLIGGTKGSRVLPSGSVAVEQYSDGLISFEPVIFNPSWGIFTLPIYYEAGAYNNLSSETTFWHGPGIGFRFYVDKVAIPALGADFTWDLENNLFKVAVSIGGTGGGD